LHDKVVFVPDPLQPGKFIPRMDLKWVKRVDQSANTPTAAKLVTRRSVAAGLAVGGVSFGVGGIGMKPAAAGILGAAAEFLARTFGAFCEEVAARALIANFAPSYEHSTQAMQLAGYSARNERGWVSGAPFAITVDDGCDAVTVISRTQVPGCSSACIVEPTDTHVLNSCLHPQVGLPALYAERGHRFSAADAMRYAAPVAARQRRGGPCGNISVYVTASCYEVDIEVLDDDYACVEITNPATGRRLENEAVPLNSGDPTKIADAGEWRII
jgi:hypothetical protein